MRFWGLVLVILALVAFTPRAKSQTPLTSQNILTPTVGAWTGSVAGQNAGFSGGGNGPAFNAATNTLIFGYTTATATQRIGAEAFAIQHALDLSNSGIKINGYNYSWQINNSGEQSGTLSGKVELLRNNTALQSYTYNYNAPTNGFELKTGTQTFVNEHTLLAADQIALSFTGRDSRFWAGYYGPQVREPSLSLNYTTDPCMGNPLYSPSCAGYNNVLTSRTMYAESYAINQALDLVGAGLKVHGLRYGYDYVLGGTWCSVAGTNSDGTLGCSTWDNSSLAVGVAVTKSDHSILYSNAHLHQEQNSSGSTNYSHTFNNSLLLGNMGGFAMVDQVNGTGAVFNKWSNWKYTPDPCVVNPLSSSSCPGYASAYQAQMCSANPLYNSACPGYAEALFNQQCTANPLMNPSCPGYAAAYLTYQCSISPLYSTTCAGYAEAYKTQQCALNGLYDRTCPNYAEAYAKKNIISTDTTSTTKTTTTTPSTVSKTEASTTISSDGAVKIEVSKTGDSNVDKAIATPTSTTNTAAAPSAPVQLTPPPAAVAERKQEQKQDDTKAENKPEGGQSAQGGQQGGQQEQKSDQPKTARQELQERRQEAAKAKAVEQGKDLANNMGKATDMEQQKQIQNVVIQAMGFTPGFDAYKVMMPDVAGYKPYSIYGNQRTVDNRSARSMFGGTDQLHNEIVNSQYK